jgi:hypothetical protein
MGRPMAGLAICKMQLQQEATRAAGRRTVDPGGTRWDNERVALIAQSGLELNMFFF